MIKLVSYHSNDSKNYTIEWDQHNVNNIEFAQKDIDKLYVAKYLIQLMNEVEPNLLNFVNYSMICEWYVQNDLAIQTAHITTRNL